MLTSGVLECASGPYALPMHIVPKDIRIVGDFRALNQSIVKDTYQMPCILEFRNKMKDAKMFSTLDLKSGSNTPRQGGQPENNFLHAFG